MSFIFVIGCQNKYIVDSNVVIDVNESSIIEDKHLTINDTIGDLLRHPAFQGFEKHIMPRNDREYEENMPIYDIGMLLPYHNHIDLEAVVTSLNRMIDDIKTNRKIFYDFYSEEQKQQDASLENTGLFFFRGNPEAPFAIICSGGGFSYVGSLHEGFPYALELNSRGYNAFVLNYRIGGERIATEDLIAAISYIEKNAEEFKVATNDYSVWGSSAGARMAANAGSFKKSGFTLPNTIVMAYTAHTAFSASEPPTFVVASEHDHIVNIEVVKNRVANLRSAGVDVEYLQFKNVAHGFGLGTGTDAEGWIYHAMDFWEKHMNTTHY